MASKKSDWTFLSNGEASVDSGRLKETVSDIIAFPYADRRTGDVISSSNDWSMDSSSCPVGVCPGVVYFWMLSPRLREHWPHGRSHDSARAA